MPEPIDERVETSWLEHLDQFDTHVYPLLFEKRGYTKGEALIAWRLNAIEQSIDALGEKLEALS